MFMDPVVSCAGTSPIAANLLTLRAAKAGGVPPVCLPRSRCEHIGQTDVYLLVVDRQCARACEARPCWYCYAPAQQYGVGWVQWPPSVVTAVAGRLMKPPKGVAEVSENFPSWVFQA